jgi:multidrug resistance efflux pump
VLKEKKTILFSAIAAVIIIIGIIIFVTGFKKNDIIEVSGILEANTTEIPTLVSGIVKNINAREGDEIAKNDIILTLDTKELEIRKEQAESIVKQANAQLEMTTSGAKPSEIKQMQAKVKQAQANLQSVASGARPEEIKQAQAKTETAQATFEKARTEYESAKRLLEEDIISKSKFEEIELAYNSAKSALTAAEESLKLIKKGASSSQLKIAQEQLAASRAALSNVMEGAKPSQVKVAQAQVEQTEAELKLIQQMIDNSKIKSPIKGTINELSVNTGELITKGAAVASILDLSNLWVKVFIPESKLVYLKLGQNAQIIPEALPDMSFPGKVAYIAQKGAFIPPGTKESVDQQVFEVRVTLDESQKENIQLRPGMSVKVKIDTSERRKQFKKSQESREK